MYIFTAEPTRPTVERCDERSQFTCDDQSCIDIRLRCDRQYDCPDGTDEYNCRKTMNWFYMYLS